MNTENLNLIQLTPEWREELFDLARDFQSVGDSRFNSLLKGGDEAFFIFLQNLVDEASEEDLPPGVVPQSTFWLVRDDAYLLGFSRLRRHMGDALLEKGGQISVEIRPSERGKGYEETLLRLTLAQAAAMGMSEVILTCAEEDAETAARIEAAGGEWLETRSLRRSNRLIRLYRFVFRA
ncbi:MAG: acetyltransferase [Bellilinea sp.]|nr:MAG: acetyltransferase [Bellilinea sp.]